MRIISWNVNGINAVFNKGAFSPLEKENADVYCFQEVKASEGKVPNILEGYRSYNSYAEKKGYSGVSIFSRLEPLSVSYGIGIEEFDREARAITAEFKEFFLINAYFPHSNRELKRLDFKLRFDDEFIKFCKMLERRKPVVIAADFNVAHKEIDLANPKTNEGNAGFTPQEREWFDKLLSSDFIDTFREFCKKGGQYTWWTYMNNARERNIGWRIDYFVISGRIRNKLEDSKILASIKGSDHCPILLELGS